MLVFTIDLFPGNGYMENKLISACIKRDKELFKDNFKIFTPDDELVKEAYSFFGKEIIDKRPCATLVADLIRIYILQKLPDALYIDADVFIQKIDLNLLKNKFGTINVYANFGVLYNGGTKKGQHYWRYITEKIKKDLIENGEEQEKGIFKMDEYYCKLFNINIIIEKDIKMVHFTRWCLLAKNMFGRIFEEKKIFFVSNEIYNALRRTEKVSDIFMVILNPNFDEHYNYPLEIPMFKDIWKDKKDFKEYILEEAPKIIPKDSMRTKLVFVN